MVPCSYFDRVSNGVVMAELSVREAHQMARRLFLIQVLLNYRTMQGGGYLFSLWPWLSKSELRERRVRLASGYVNSHPVLASFAVGAMRRRLEDLSIPPPKQGEEEFDSWRKSLAGPLGMIGDSLIWDRWKPLVFALGAGVLLVIPTVTAWCVVATTCLIVYNVPLYALRVWGIRRGYVLGANVLDAMRDERFASWRRGLTAAGVVLAGLLLGSAVHVAAQGSPARALQFMVAFAAMLLGLRFRLAAGTAALIATIIVLLPAIIV